MKTQYENIHTLDSIWNDLKLGDIVVFQEMKKWSNETEFNIITKPILSVIIGYDVADMAMEVHYVPINTFFAFNHKLPQLSAFAEWMDYWNVLGHWHHQPTLTELKIAMKKAIPTKEK